MKWKDIQELSLGMTILFIIGGVIVLAIITLLFVGTGFARPVLLDMQREGNQRSQQFIDTTVKRLYQLKRKYDDLEADIERLSDSEDNQATIDGMKARQDSLLDEMEQEASSIPLEEIPISITDLLRTRRF